MDISSAMPSSWFADPGDEDPMALQEFLGYCLADYPLQDMVSAMEEELHLSLSSASECNSSTGNCEKLNDHTVSPITGPNNKKAQVNISFADLSCSSNNHCTGTNENNNNNNNNNVALKERSSVKGQGRSLSSVHSTARRPKRLPDQCHNHIIAERQRRQTLSQGFIALSALIPGLKKIDKTSVIGEAINHLKQLQERLKNLEEQNARQSVMVVKRSQVLHQNEGYSCSGNENSPLTSHDHQLPEIEARFCDKSVLIKIYCSMQKGILTKIITQIERDHLSVSNINAMSFNGSSSLDITILAKMESGFEMTPGEVVKDLQSIFECSV